MDTPNELRARAHELHAEAHKLEAEAERLAATPSADEWIALKPRVEISGFGCKGRCIVDAGRRGELEISRIGGKPSVKRSELTRWAESRRVSPKTRDRKQEDAEADDYAAIVQAGGR